MAEKCAMKKRRERRTLAARGDIPAAKVRHDIDAGQLGQQCRLAKLQRVARAVELLRAMPNGLPVGPDRTD